MVESQWGRHYDLRHSKVKGQRKNVATASFISVNLTPYAVMVKLGRGAQFTTVGDMENFTSF